MTDHQTPERDPAEVRAELRLHRAAAAALLGFLHGNDPMTEAAHDAAEVEGPIAAFVPVVAELAAWAAPNGAAYRDASTAVTDEWATRPDRGTRAGVEWATRRFAYLLTPQAAVGAVTVDDLLAATVAEDIALADLCDRLTGITTLYAGIPDHPDPHHTARCRRAAAMRVLGGLRGDQAMIDHATDLARREESRYPNGLPGGATVFEASAPIEAAYAADPDRLRAALEDELRRVAHVPALPDDDEPRS